MKMNGITAIAKATNPNSEFAQWIPKFPYMLFVASGKQTAVIERMVLAAACAEAEFCWYASVR